MANLRPDLLLGIQILAIIIKHKTYITVTCAIIEKDGKVLCAQRSEKMKHPLKWEFPGGKVEKNEDLEACLKEGNQRRAGR